MILRGVLVLVLAFIADMLFAFSVPVPALTLIGVIAWATFATYLAFTARRAIRKETGR